MSIPYSPTAGTHISEAIEKAISLATGHRDPVEFSFNGVCLIVNEESAPAEVEKLFYMTLELNGKAHDTPIRRAEEEARRRKYQEELDAFLPTLHALDMASQSDVLHWLCNFETLSSWTFVNFDRERVLAKFTEAGYVPSDFCKDVDESVDQWRERVGRDGEFRWIVGQALDGIKHIGCPHQMIHTFSEGFLLKDILHP